MRWISALAAAFLILATSPSFAASRPQIKIYAVQDSFENVKQDVVDAIIKRGLVVDYTAQVGAMLARTGKDIGATQTIYTDAQSVQFCSASLSRKTMEADPANLAFCPYVIFVYALAGSPGTSYVGYRPLPLAGSKPSKASLAAVNKLLDAIAREAAKKK